MHEEVPTFNGDVKDYPWWSDEMRTCVLKDQPDTWCLRTLQKYTPKEDDLTIHETLKDAWSFLDKKYANPVSVSSRLISTFVNDGHVTGGMMIRSLCTCIVKP